MRNTSNNPSTWPEKDKMKRRRNRGGILVAFAKASKQHHLNVQQKLYELRELYNRLKNENYILCTVGKVLFLENTFLFFFLKC